MEVDDQDLINRIGKTSKKTLRDTGRYVSDTDNPFLEKKRFKRPPISLGKKHYRDKIEYLVDRMGVDLTMQDLEDLKIVTSLNSFMKLNEMEHLKEYYEQSNGLASLRTFLEKYSLGFLSMDTNYMGFRHTQDHHSGRRYYTESMNRPFDIGSKIYTIGGELDLLSPTLNLVLTEGVMDITSVWLNLYDKEKSKDTVFCSANGKSFLLVVKMLRRLGFLSMNLDMYSDNDVDLDYYKFILDYDNFNSIRIHYNTFKKEKDFGVSKDKIKEKVFKLK
jgi:hypothetical protein